MRIGKRFSRNVNTACYRKTIRVDFLTVVTLVLSVFLHKTGC